MHFQLCGEPAQIVCKCPPAYETLCFGRRGGRTACPGLNPRHTADHGYMVPERAVIAVAGEIVDRRSAAFIEVVAGHQVAAPGTRVVGRSLATAIQHFDVACRKNRVVDQHVGECADKEIVKAPGRLPGQVEGVRFPDVSAELPRRAGDSRADRRAEGVETEAVADRARRHRRPRWSERSIGR